MTTQETRELLDTAKRVIEATAAEFERTTGLELRIEKWYGADCVLEAKIITTDAL